MEINYIILAHKNPCQVKKLITRLNEPWVKFYVHIDKNVKLEEFERALNQDNLVFLTNEERQSGIWGDLGIVKGTINALKKISGDKRKGFCILLSGQDYPLQTNEEIRKHLDENKHTSFMEIFEMPGIWKQNGIDRIRKYKINKSSKKGHFLLLPSIFSKDLFSYETAGKLNYLRKTGQYKKMILTLKVRKFPNYLKPCGGSQWWALPIDVVEQILNFLEDHPDYLDYHEYTLLPDEIFFQSIVAGLIDEQKVKPSITYANWTKPYGPYPATFQESDLDELIIASKKKLFARKFDTEIYSAILDLIDLTILNQK